MGRYSWLMIVMLLSAARADANDLRQLYELAQTRDMTLQAAQFQRDALIEARPQACTVVAATCRQWLGDAGAGGL